MRVNPKYPVITAAEARRLFMQGQGLLTSDDRPVTVQKLYREIESLGFVQLDTISVVERAHHHILATRFRSYAPDLLDALHRSGKLFEHMTHDASLIPSCWFPHWRHRFARAKSSAWFRSQLGAHPRKILRAVRQRIEREGPLMARHFEDPRAERGTWWQWKPAKAALEYLWRAGDLAVAKRVQFQKVYDLTERVLPRMHAAPKPSAAEHVQWACSTAIDRLAVATPAEVAAFWRAVPLAQVRRWLETAVKRGELLRVEREDTKGRRKSAYAVVDWRLRLKKAASAPEHIRLLSPFDPLVRDRRRCLELFDFDYRFEAFVPAPQRKYGYYVLPILMGDRLVGRLNPKLDRKAGQLTVIGLWWEPGFKVTKAVKSELVRALNRYSAFIGATGWRAEASVERALNVSRK